MDTFVGTGLDSLIGSACFWSLGSRSIDSGTSADGDPRSRKGASATNNNTAMFYFLKAGRTSCVFPLRKGLDYPHAYV